VLDEILAASSGRAVAFTGTGWAGGCAGVWGGVINVVEAERLAKFELTLHHAGADLLGEDADRGAKLGHGIAQAARREGGSRPSETTHDKHARGRTQAKPE
jgi:hypothetical protein